MLTPGNKKLGKHLIWGFGLPSGRAEICVGMTSACRRVCYAVRTEQYRPQAARQYERKLGLTKKRGFVRRVRAFLIAHYVRVVRIHTGGDFYSARYARKWLAIIRRSPRVRFFTYSRAWSIPPIREVLETLAVQPNCQIWFSTDRQSGWPEGRSATVRIAWLMTSHDDRPPTEADLVFRVQGLRRQPHSQINGVPVCPAEDGVARTNPTTCDHCQNCWRPPASESSDFARIPLQILDLTR